jgi:hypothetical protein
MTHPTGSIASRRYVSPLDILIDKEFRVVVTRLAKQSDIVKVIAYISSLLSITKYTMDSANERVFPVTLTALTAAGILRGGVYRHYVAL